MNTNGLVPWGSCTLPGTPFTSLLSPFTEPRHGQCVPVVEGSSLATWLERVKEVRETKWNRIRKIILGIMRRKKRGRNGWGKEDFFEVLCKSAVIWCLRLPSCENCCLKKEGYNLSVGVRGYPSHQSPFPRADPDTVSTSPPTCITCGQRFFLSS